MDNTKIGLIADTHVPGTTSSLWPQITEAFKDVDYILHAGDLWTIEVIDELNAIAPTYVARGNGDIELTDDRLKDTWLIEFDNVHVGMVHEFPTPRRRDNDFILRKRDKIFPETQPDVIVYGHTHYDEVHRIDGLLCVNPGSPTLPRNQSVQFGTIGFLDISRSHASATLFQITETGISPIEQ
jgi:putative phosphoesterase